MHLVPVVVRVPLAFLAIFASTLLHVAVLFAAMLPKWLLPFAAVRRVVDPLLAWIAESWIGFNSGVIRSFTRTRVLVTSSAQLRHDGHYLVLCNHRSWVDIPALQFALNRRVPLLRFFLKSQLFWVPLLGIAWWALDFPFMKRYTREQVERRPELAGRDIEATRRACRKFATIPVAVTNFVEGTRFTPAKHAAQASPFVHLLKPKSGGVAFVLDAMGDGLQSILDITIAYPRGTPTLLQLFANRVPEIRIDIVERPIPRAFAGGDYAGDALFRQRFQDWMNALWREKDATMARLLADAGDGT